MVSDPDRPSLSDTALPAEQSPGKGDGMPRLGALAKHASHRTNPPDDGEDVPVEQISGSYAPLADKLHRAKPTPPILQPGDMVMRPVKRLSEKARLRAVVDKTIRSAVARGTIEPEAGEALLAGRYSQWLDQKFSAETAADDTPPAATATKPAVTPARKL